MESLLRVDRLSVDFRSGFLGRRAFRAVDDVSFSIAPGETLALVGESGSGKSTIGRAILGLTPTSSGSITFDDHELKHRTRADWKSAARDIQVIYQDPYSSLNPSRTIGDILRDPIVAQGGHDARAATQIVKDMLERVHLPADAASRYPARFSGGQRQRIAIARALVLRPRLIVCDEPTSALDVSTQASVLELLTELQQEFGLAYLFITHDLAVVRHFADNVIVLQKGAVAERGTAAQICESPNAAYTRRLVAAAPVPDPVVQRERRLARTATAE